MKILDDLAKQFSYTRTQGIGKAVEELCDQAIMQRRNHERRWYDNQSFDDGQHFKVVSRKTGQTIDHVNKSTGYVERAIPRASRQIRGVSNLLFAAEPYPVIYPQRVTFEQFRNPQTGQIDQDAFMQAGEKSKQVAKKQGIWLTNEWENQNLQIKNIDLILLAAKNSVSFLQVYSESEKQKICTEIFDAFDIILYGDRRELSDCPFITKTKAMELKDILYNPLFDPEMVKRLTPDNKYATSEIKEAYMRSRYGMKTNDKEQASIIVKETFMKEVLNEENWKESIRKDAGGSMEGKSKGDGIMRHVFSAGGVTLRDEYVDYDEYPFVDFRFEPGPLYQVPFIERFIPQNKSLDIIVTRLEKWVNSMIVGVYQQRKGESFEVTNMPGGQILQYETTPLTQMQNSTVGNTPFEVISLMDKYIEEQGASTAALGNMPSGVKSGVAIESLKSTEYANLKISTLMLKKSIKTIAERMLERAHKDFLKPQEVEHLEDGEPSYFDIIGKRGFDLSKQVGKTLPADTVTIDKTAKVRIEIEPGLGLTMDGKRQSMQQIIEYMLKLTEQGFVTKEALQIVIKRFLETFGFGSTQELMEAMDVGTTKDGMTEDNIMQMKVAMIEAMKDAGAVGPEAEARLVDSTKVGVVEALKDTGMLDKQQEQPKQTQNKVSINYKDLPTEGKVQAAELAGIAIDPQATKQKDIVDNAPKKIDNNSNQ